MLPSAPQYVTSLIPYVPGKPIEETQREFKIKRVIKLASNENPLGPSPKAVLALKKSLNQLNLYPDGSGFRLKNALSQHLKLSTDQVIVGNGSNELIDFLIRAYCTVGDSIVTSKAAFIAYKICAQIHGVRTIETEMDSQLRFDLGAMLEAVKRDERVKMVFISNPNNPTGTHVSGAAVREFLNSLNRVRGGSVLCVLDCAYWEYVNDPQLTDPMLLLKDFPQVVILRTFSKVYGLAGLRVGYGIAHPEIVGTLEKVRMPFNINSLALVAAEAALSDRAFVSRSVRVNAQGMKFWEKELAKMGIRFWKSQGNFILADVAQGFGKSGPDLYQDCLRQGVILRPVANYGLPRALRISIGTPEENQFAVRVLKKLKGGQ